MNFQKGATARLPDMHVVIVFLFFLKPGFSEKRERFFVYAVGKKKQVISHRVGGGGLVREGPVCPSLLSGGGGGERGRRL